MEAIHYEALRKQMICDKRTANQKPRETLIPPYQPSYAPNELPNDDKFSKIVKQNGDYVVIQYVVKKDKNEILKDSEEILITQANGRIETVE